MDRGNGRSPADIQVQRFERNEVVVARGLVRRACARVGERTTHCDGLPVPFPSSAEALTMV